MDCSLPIILSMLPPEGIFFVNPESFFPSNEERPFNCESILSRLSFCEAADVSPLFTAVSAARLLLACLAIDEFAVGAESLTGICAALFFLSLSELLEEHATNKLAEQM